MMKLIILLSIIILIIGTFTTPTQQTQYSLPEYNCCARDSPQQDNIIPGS